MEPESIENWHRIDDRLTTSGQPDEAQLAGIAALGVRHVVNLGLHSHTRALPDEAASVAAPGMRYVHIPVDFTHPTEADYAAFAATMTALGDEPVHVHCIANYRVSAFLYRYRRDTLGIDDATARAEMTRIWAPDAVWEAFVTPGPG